MWAKIIKIGVRVAKNKTIRTVLISVLIITLFLVLLGPVVTGISAVASAANFITKIAQDMGIAPSDISEDDILDAISSGHHISVTQEAELRMRSDTFEHLLTRVSEFNHAGEKSRTITIYGEKKTTSTDPETKETTTDVEYVPREVEVDNSQYEGISNLDYKLIYIGCVMAACDRDASSTILSTVTPKDCDLKTINSGLYEKEDDLGGYYITKEDVDKVFSYLTPEYNYSFDVLRDTRDEYDYTDCESLPHITESAGGVTYHIPQSYLKTGIGGYSQIENVMSGNTVTATKETFDFEKLKSKYLSLNKYSSDTLLNCFKSFPDGLALYNKYEEWGREHKQIGGKSPLSIKVDPAFASVGDFTYEYSGNLLNLSAQQQQTLNAIWNYLVNTMGFSQAAAAGICGNIMQECTSLNPSVGVHGTGAAGLFQWMDSRKSGLLALPNPESLETQLAYFKSEFYSSYAASINKYCTTYFGKSFTDIDNPEQAAEAFAVIYEGCICKSDGKLHSQHNKYCSAASNGKEYQHLSLRLDYANSIYPSMGTLAFSAYDGTDLPYFPQGGKGSENWALTSLGIGTISSRGCSICCAAMAATYCLNKVITPKDIASISTVYSWTSTHSSMNQTPYQLAFASLGVRYRQLDTGADLSKIKEQITSALQQHHPVILSVKKGSYGFTNNTHYIVLRYMDSSGGVRLHDPNGWNHSSYSFRAFSLDEILTQLNNRSGCVECIPNER